MDLKALQLQAAKEANKKSSQTNGQPQNGTKPRLCTNPLAQLALNGPSKALDEYWKTCLREVNKEKKKDEQKGGPNFLEADWLELRQFIHQVYHEVEPKPELLQKNPKIEKVIKRLCNKDSQQLLLFLESQVQEYVIEVKVGLLELLNKNAPGVLLSRSFLSVLVGSYGRLCAAAKCLAPPLKGVEEKHLSMFGMSWEDLNKLLFERCVHADPVMQLKVPQFIGHLHASLPAKDKSSFYGIFQRILALEDEMTNIAAKWKKVENFVHDRKNVASLSSMMEELKLDSCGGGAKVAAAAAVAAAKEQCECRICTSPLLQQLSSMGLTSQNYKEVRERLRKMLDQKAMKKAAAISAAQAKVAASSGKSSAASNKATTSHQANSSPTPSTGSQNKTQGKQKGNQQQQQQQKTKGVASNVPSNPKQKADLAKQAAPPVPAQPSKPVTSKTPAPMPAHVKHVPPPPPPSSTTTKQPNFVSGKQATCATNGKHPTCCCAEAKLAARKASRHVPSLASSTSSTQPSTPVNDPRDIDALVDFIEGTDRGQAKHKDEKKAAKKARQKLKKLQEKQHMDDEDDEEEEDEEEEVPAPASAVVRVNRNTPAPNINIPPRQGSAQASKTAASKGPPQMVTIRRVMEPTSSEPTVTITLKGDTPEKDTVLFTLVNGQVCKDEEKAQNQKKGQQNQNQKQQQQQQQQQQQRATTNGTAKNQQQQQPGENKSKKNKKKTEAKNKQEEPKAAVKTKPASPAQLKPHVTLTPLPHHSSTAGTILEPTSYLPSGPTQPLRPPTANSFLFTGQAPGMGAFYAPASPRPAPAPMPVPAQQTHNVNSNFTLDSIRLPPGITITKVEAPTELQRAAAFSSGQQSKEPPQSYTMPPPPQLPPGVTLASPRMGGMPGPMGMGGMGGMPNPNVIVVDTGKLIEDNKNSLQNSQQGINGQDGRKGQGQRGQMEQMSQGSHTMVTMTSAPGNYVTLKRVTEEYPGSGMPRPVNSFNGSVNCHEGDDGGANVSSKKKKNKKKNKGKKVDEWNLVESVFTPKDIDLDAVDDDERELEAFKRFCFNSVPRERKEKVHLNIKDLVIKKKP